MTAVDRRREVKYARRIVIKVGTPVLTHFGGNIALGRIGAIVEQIAELIHEGREVILVTSGAVATGSTRLRRSITLSSRFEDTLASDKLSALHQAAAAAVGQSLLMSMYETLFSQYNLSCAQVLIDAQAMTSGQDDYAQVCETTLELLATGAVPILNDNAAAGAVMNDLTNEVAWDNDTLAERVACEVRADLLVFLTDSDGLYARAVPSAPPMRLSVFSSSADLVREPVSGSREDEVGIYAASRRSNLPSQFGVIAEQRPCHCCHHPRHRWPTSRAQVGLGRVGGRTRLSAEAYRALIEAGTSSVGRGVRVAVVATGALRTS